MVRKILPFAAALLLFASGVAILFFRQVTIYDGEETILVRPRAWTVGQALYAAEFHLDPLDQVTPGLDRPIPLNGKIQVQRAVLAFVWEDGRLRPAGGQASTPGELLNQAGISLSEDDRLLWNGGDVSRDEQLPRGTPLVLQIIHPQPVVLDLNGIRQEALSTGPYAARALWDAGVRITPGDRVSVDPAAPLDLGSVIGYRSARPLSISVGESQFQARSAAETVGAALAEAGVSLQGLDYSQPADDQPLPDDGEIRVVRVREEMILAKTLVPYESQFAPDPELDLDLIRVSQPGQFGVEVARERVRYEDGQEVFRAADSNWTAASPVPETIGYGTKIVTQTESIPGGTIEYWRKIRVRATSYSPCRLGTGDGRCSYTTASGARLTKGIVAVSLSWFRMMRGQQVYIPGYGYGVIGDYGALPGMWIDLGFDEENFEQEAIVGYVDMYFLTPVPATIPWTLP